MRSDVRIQHLLNKPDDEVIIMSDKVKKINEYGISAIRDDESTNL